ncbi:MAG: indolepyruvate ferredoxin oxidoreductase subunit alpha [Candidatus Njordarchaeales archaeon]
MSRAEILNRELIKYRYLIEETGTFLISGNDAVARGAIEAGIRIAVSYPGTPASDILAAISKVAKYHGIHAEWATNEKVAYEIAYAAALTGLRALFSSKHLGINVASDTILVSAYTGVNGGLVIVSVDDIHPWSSQNAEDTRYYARLAKIPCLEPTSPSEARKVVKYAFEISEELQLPVMVRYTEKLADTYELVEVEPIDKHAKLREAEFRPDPERYVMIAPHTRKNHPILNSKNKKAEELFNDCIFNEIIGPEEAEIGIVACGVAFQYVMEAIEKLNIGSKVRILKLVTTHPIPKKLVKEFLKSVKKVLVVEEIEPIIETEIKAIAQEENYTHPIYGRRSGHIPREYELTPDTIMKALADILTINGKNFDTKINIPPRIPHLCAGCPHRISYLAIKQALKELGVRGIIVGDRGCYNQGVHPPLRAIDTCIAMGASIGMACGFYHAGVKEPIIAVIGDSTFFHAGIPPLIDAVMHKANITIVVLDNSITAMTGHQPCPTTGRTAVGDQAPVMRPERIAEAIGVSYIRVVGTSDFHELVRILKEAIRTKGVSLVVIRSPCALELARGGKISRKYVIDYSRCIECGTCMRVTGCPAIIQEDDKIVINAYECTGCGLCKAICPVNAIEEAKVIS